MQQTLLATELGGDGRKQLCSKDAWGWMTFWAKAWALA
jgi:hypothetical protein